MSVRLRHPDLCTKCHSTFVGDQGKEGVLPSSPDKNCALCRLLLASTARIQALNLKPLRSYSVDFHRLIQAADVKQDEPRGSDTAAQLRYTMHASQNEITVTDGYTEFKRKPILGGSGSEDQGLKYYTSAEPHRSATVRTRLRLGDPEKGLDPKAQHLQMSKATTQLKSRIRRVAETCKIQHKSCGRSLSFTAEADAGQEFPYPVRLLRVEVVNGVHKARLVELKGELPTYACLSHRWCGNEQYKTTKTTIDDEFVNIPFDSLPKTFQDAAIVAQSLDVGHLWIDSISIIQDDTEDWRQQSTQMGLIFQRSYCALAAIDAFATSEKDAGLLLERNAMPTEVMINSSFSAQYEKILPPLSSQMTTQSLDSDKEEDQFTGLSSSSWRKLKYELRHQFTSFEMSVERSSWNSRGWIFQERLLSPRILYFTQEQIYWECAAGIVSEETDLDGVWGQTLVKGGIKKSSRLASDNLHQLLRSQGHHVVAVPAQPESKGDMAYTWKEHESMQLWWRITERYSECMLTFSKDRWFAIAGLCEILQARYGSEIHAGIWEKAVGAGLLWHARITPLRPLEHFSAPSWSWLGLDGPIGYAYADYVYTSCIQKVFPLLQRHKFEVVSMTGAPNGSSYGFGGKLSLTCPVVSASVSTTKFEDFQFRETTGQTTSVSAWKYFQTVTAGQSALELAREYRSMSLPPTTRLLYSAGSSGPANGSQNAATSPHEPPRAIGWVVLDRDGEPEGPVHCAFIVRRELYGIKLHGVEDTRQQVAECVVLVRDQVEEGGEERSTYRRVGRGRLVASGVLNEARTETIDII